MKNKKKPKDNNLGTNMVSVIVPVYNAEKFLDKCIGSVLGQTYKKIELLLVDDGSKDDSKKICERYISKDRRVKIIFQENRGPAAARNTGIKHAKGELVFFLDADDFIEKNTLEILLEKYNQSQPDLVMSNFNKLENNGEIKKQSVVFSLDEGPFEHHIKELSKTDIVEYVRHFLKHPSNHLVSYCWARLYKLSIIKENSIFANENMRLFEDFVFNLEYLKHTNKIVFVNENLYTYTMHDNHVSVSMVAINSDSLLHDMNVFKRKASEFFQLANTNTTNISDIKREIGHALVHYVIIFMIRSCRQITKNNRKRISNEIYKMVNSSIFRDSLRYYSPSKGNSRILPLLMKLRTVGLLMFFCKHRANKRYGKPKEA